MGFYSRMDITSVFLRCNFWDVGYVGGKGEDMRGGERVKRRWGEKARE